MENKIDRRSFASMFAAFAVLCPVLPARASTKRGLTVELLPDLTILLHRKMYGGKGSSVDMDSPPLPHGNSATESWEVFECEDGIKTYMGTLTFNYNKMGYTEIRDRSGSTKTGFESFFGLTVNHGERISFKNSPERMERRGQDEEEVLVIAEMMVEKAKDKMQTMMDKYKVYTSRLNTA